MSIDLPKSGDDAYSKSLPDGVHVWIKGSDIEKCVEIALKEWAVEHADEASAMVRRMTEYRSTMHQDNGMTIEGNMRLKMEVPVKLAYKIQKMTHKDWLRDDKILRAVAKQAPGLCIKGTQRVYH